MIMSFLHTFISPERKRAIIHASNLRPFTFPSNIPYLTHSHHQGRLGALGACGHSAGSYCTAQRHRRARFYLEYKPQSHCLLWQGWCMPVVLITMLNAYFITHFLHIRLSSNRLYFMSTKVVLAQLRSNMLIYGYLHAIVFYAVTTIMIPCR